MDYEVSSPFNPPRNLNFNKMQMRKRKPRTTPFRKMFGFFGIFGYKTGTRKTVPKCESQISILFRLKCRQTG